jgi:membrane-bound serine protease (ClpP class)
MEMLYWGLGLIALTLLLLVLEMFVPTAGALAVGAVIAAVAGAVCLFKYDTAWGVSGTLALLGLVPALFLFGLKVWPHTGLGRRIIGTPTEEEIEKKRLAEEEERRRQNALIGAEGTVLVDLRPIGIVEVQGKRFDARSDAFFVAAGSKIRVVAVEGNELRVRATT